MKTILAFIGGVVVGYSLVSFIKKAQINNGKPPVVIDKENQISGVKQTQ